MVGGGGVLKHATTQVRQIGTPRFLYEVLGWGRLDGTTGAARPLTVCGLDGSTVYE